ncbi:MULTISPECIES: hypothetical protein [Burkholderiales]|jgi:hypothetical protein|uniref:Uncharacterized protein n=2 Tax=Burkholderiales TaxID=80840 RepID=A0A848NY59_9RALS|nr:MULTISPECIES: hypothetical protein [Burkholderiales]EPD43696.1 hypothetical protein HMPREF9701_00721 [Delftia acidovorans CCUG 274B]MDH1251803.1 hypothetical protein [Comamonas thiooxydans]MDR3064358.1 hypothetical protein [Comamonas sp.]NMV40291.1 hypothetical protein [Ralstonia insidiosa]SDY12418.1 hypothetical protein SAMN05421547_102559 [Delftia lacustris]
MKILRKNGKTAIKLMTPSGVVAIIAADTSAELLAAMRRKLERKLQRSGHLRAQSCPDAGSSTGSE